MITEIKPQGQTAPVMSPEAKALAEKFTELMSKADGIRKPYDGKLNDMPDDIAETYDKAMDEALGVGRTLELQKKADVLKGYAMLPASDLPVTAPNEDRISKAIENMENVGFDSPELKAAVKGFIDQIKAPEILSAFRKGITQRNPSFTPEEQKALDRLDLVRKAAGQSMGSDTGGGYLVAPMQFITELIKNIDNYVFIRQYARTWPLVKAASLGACTLASDLPVAQWTAELQPTARKNVAFGRRELKPDFLSTETGISKPLLRFATIDPESILADRVAQSFGYAEEIAFLTGDGDKKPLGIMTVGTNGNGISTNRDFTTGTAGTTKADDIIDAYGKLKVQYRPRSIWGYHRDMITFIRKMKDNQGAYVWHMSDFQGRMLTGEFPGLIMGRPYFESEYMPGATGAQGSGKYVGFVGDLNFYWIADSLDMDVQVLYELYARQNEIGYIARKETDGMPVLEEAFVRLIVQ